MSIINIKKIKIKDILSKRDNAYKATGYKLAEILDKVLKTSEKPLLLILDFHELELLTYGFVEVALKGLVQYTKKKNDVIVLYEINKFELEELITGIIDMLELQSQNQGKLDERTLLEKYYFVAYKGEDNQINYIGQLNEVEKYILKIIEQEGETNHNRIDETLKSKSKSHYCEDIAKSVERLFSLGFIFQIEKSHDNPSIYYSLKYLQNHAN